MKHIPNTTLLSQNARGALIFPQHGKSAFALTVALIYACSAIPVVAQNADDTADRSTSAKSTAPARAASVADVSISTTYDPNGNPTESRRTQGASNHVIQRQYDDQNRLEREQGNAGGASTAAYTHAQRYVLDGNGNRTTIVDSAGVTTNQTFDAFNRLKSITNIEGTTNYSWQKDGLLSTISRANGVHSAYQYDRAKRITSLTHSRNGATTSSFVYSYDLNGNRTKEVLTVAAINGQVGSITTTDYTFDGDDRLTGTVVRHQPPSATMPDERTDWVLDGVGNRRSEVVTRLSDNTVTSDKLYTYTIRGQLLMMNDGVNGLSVQYGYSGNGNRTSRTVTKPGQTTQTINFIFDARDLMIKVEPEAPNVAGIPTVEYTYDAEGRRIERIETPATGGASEVTLFIYTGQTLLHEAEPATVAGGLHVTDTYRHGANLDRHVAYAADNTYLLRHYQLDALGTPIAMTDSTGATVTRTAFDAWGNTREQVANGTVQTPWQLPNYSPANTGQARLLSGDGQSIGFTGYQKDEATGLYYAGARWYDPLVGGFNAMDPAMGDNSRPVTFNKYLYANANPLVYVDPDGRYGVFFDGTGNNQNSPEFGHITNVAKLSRLYDQSAGADYSIGVGTGAYETAFTHGSTGKGVRARVEAAYQNLVRFYNSDEARNMRANDPKRWEEVKQIDVFGFSRGSTEARAFANKVKAEGIPNQDDTYQKEVWAGYGRNIHREKRTFTRDFKSVDIRFMGIYDTVDARGVPFASTPSSDLTIDPKFVRNTVHLVAANEYRTNFDSVSACYSATSCASNIQEYYIPGAHSDIGGSYGPSERQGGVEKRDGIDKYTLALMWKEARENGVPLSLPSLEDRTGVDPFKLSEDQLTPYVHDSRQHATGYIDRGMDRTTRTIYYGNGSSENLSVEEQYRRWRRQQGMSERVVEGADGQTSVKAN
ncbi:MAG: DUF2235 domain-containing protein [Planctomycetota bacterium]|nr:DUF2235 domain-containing protein [Planctomycetota bacterium]